MPSRAGSFWRTQNFEFGLIEEELIWIDEALTPDSFRASGRLRVISLAGPSPR